MTFPRSNLFENFGSLSGHKAREVRAFRPHNNGNKESDTNPAVLPALLFKPECLLCGTRKRPTEEVAAKPSSHQQLALWGGEPIGALGRQRIWP